MRFSIGWNSVVQNTVTKPCHLSSMYICSSLWSDVMKCLAHHETVFSRDGKDREIDFDFTQELPNLRGEYNTGIFFS